MIYSIGIDIVHIPKFKKAVERWGDKIKKRIFTKGELAYCKNRRFSEQHLAVRFAAKEAFIKALGRGVGSKEIEVTNNSDGRPYIILNSQFPIPNLVPAGLKLSQQVPKFMSPNVPIGEKISGTSLSREQGSELRTHLSLYHDGDYCIAQVILETKEQ